ncbi:MAG: hypothetical protein LBS43_11865 [Prevotellaceae bacterium]|jgi:TonB-dependent SusC/RagA subfamily outer membrane receptor|nr:hypothetical protein [Prevotellaceae bacterium]
MNELLIYLLKTALIQCAMLLCYRMLLQSDTFYKMIRYYFMGGLAFSYIAPLIRFDFRILPSAQNNIPEISYTYIPEMSFPVEQLPQTTALWWQQYSLPDILTAVFVAGAAVMMIRFVIQFLSLASLRTDRKHRHQTYCILDVDAPIKPFSFGKRIYINSKLHSDGELDEIIRHELVHIRQNHSVDIIVAAVNRIIFWWNPFAWILNGDIHNNLEYIVDNEMLLNGTNRKHYQYHLLNINQLTYINNDMANYFNYYNLKKRIEMMNKEKTQPVYKIKWLLAPIGAIVILLAFNAQRAIATNVDFAVTNEIVEITSDTLMINCRCCDDSTRPLIFIDGKEYSSNEVTNLDAYDIHSFSIIKDAAATAVYGDKGKNGVIIVKTKENHKISETKKLLYSMDWLKQTNVKHEPLVIIDEKESNEEELQKLEDIESISVIKDAAATVVYGDKGKNGVIIVKTK